MTVHIASPKFEGVHMIETPLDMLAWCQQIRDNGGIQLGELWLKPEDLRTEFHD